jgi:hypothetical protein
MREAPNNIPAPKVIALRASAGSVGGVATIVGGGEAEVVEFM